MLKHTTKDTYKKKIAIVGIKGLPPNYGGFETLADNLVKRLNGKYQFIVYNSIEIDRKKSAFYQKGHKITFVHLPLRADGISGIFFDLICVYHAFFQADVILYLGPGIGPFLTINLLLKKNLIINHGGFNEWERSKLNRLERFYAYYNHKLAAHTATFNVVDSETLNQSLYNHFGIRSCVITYGGDHVSAIKKTTNNETYLFDYAISVARADPDNNIELILEVYSRLPDKYLIFISNWSHSSYGRKLRQKFTGIPNITLTDAIYDRIKLDSLRTNAKLYIHSHALSGASPSLIEAMTLGNAIISFDTPVNRETTKNRAVYFNNLKSLQNIVTTIDDSSLIRNGRQMKEIAEKYYKWELIAKSYAKLFDNE